MPIDDGDSIELTAKDIKLLMQMFYHADELVGIIDNDLIDRALELHDELADLGLTRFEELASGIITFKPVDN